jgi:hypothetical protein
MKREVMKLSTQSEEDLEETEKQAESRERRETE